LLVEWSRTYGRGVLRGIGQYVQTHGRWKVYHTERTLSEAAPPWLRNWQGDGIIARIENRKLAGQITQLGLPVVDLFEHENPGPVPAVLTDNERLPGWPPNISSSEDSGSSPTATFPGSTPPMSGAAVSCDTSPAPAMT
jgi:hypothetical protein